MTIPGMAWQFLAYFVVFQPGLMRFCLEKCQILDSYKNIAHLLNYDYFVNSIL
jgi:hypothetical protein